jgi:hypothetical protein
MREDERKEISRGGEDGGNGEKVRKPSGGEEHLIPTPVILEIADDGNEAGRKGSLDEYASDHTIPPV